MADNGALLLVVDDNKVNRLLLARSLETQGHRVELAENGKVALDKLRAQSFDALLLDIEMPEMNGFQVLEEMKADAKLHDVPVIVTSAVEGLESVVRCIELGAEDYLSKPVNPVLLKARLGSALARKQLRDQQKEMVRRFATSAVADDMQQSGFALGGRHLRATVMFSDIRGFTSMTEVQTPDETIELLNNYYALMFDAISGQGGVVNQMIGDGLMAVFGAPLPLEESSASAIRAALDMMDMVGMLNLDRAAAKRPDIRIGIGISTGEMVAGYTGTQQRATYTCVGDTVNRAARLEAHTKTVQRWVLIDGAARDEVGDEFKLAQLDDQTFKGKSESVRVYAVER